MHKFTRSMFFALAVMLLAFAAQADTIIVQGVILQNTNWTSNNVYLLRGGVFVGNDQSETVLTIQPGTTIKGESASGGFLCIRRYSKIIADGTAAQPITFVSDKPIGQQNRGDWGGLIINGLAHVNLTGGVGQGEGGTGQYGGGVNYNDDDNSGILRYVRIAYSGYPITPEDELNGIAFQGVGRGTTVDYVQVMMAGDDGMEFFGGSVNVKHICISGALDDEFDWTFGWNGKTQFLVIQEYGDVADHGFECDNNEFNYSALPRSNPSIYNLTLVGDTNPVGNPIGLLLRRGTAATIKNSVVINFEDCGIDIDDAATFANAWDSTTQSLNGQLVVDYSVFYGNGTIAQTGETGSQLETSFAFTSPQFIQTLNVNNRFEDPNLMAPTDTLNPDFRPAAGSLCWNGFTQPPADPFFSQVDYVGGMGSVDWTAGWRLFPSSGSQVSQPMTLVAGWNLVSLPVVPANNSLTALFPSAVVAYKFVPGTGYVNTTTLENGKAYWVNVPATVTDYVIGNAFASYSTAVTPPWEMLGSVYSPDQVPVAHNGAVNVVYSYNPGTGYVASVGNMMQPSKGYWVNMTTGTDSLSLGGNLAAASQPNKSSSLLDETDDIWSLILTATGEAGSAPNVFTNVIGGGAAQSFIPAPPPPPSYMTYTQLYTDSWQGPYIQMVYQWPPQSSVLWKLEVDPNGNVPPPTQNRVTVISWNPVQLPAEGNFRIINAVYGDTVVQDMRTQTSFSVSGTQLKYYNIIYAPAVPPTLDVTLTPLNPPIVIPANGGSFQFNASVLRTVGPQTAFTVWARDKYPDGTYTNPLLGPVTINPPVGTVVTRLRVQNVPSTWPAGLHAYLGYANSTYSYPAMDSSIFTWTKSAVANGGPFVGDANCFGQLFDGEMQMTGVVVAHTMVNTSPNPFNPSTTLTFSLPEAMQVALNVYDVQGRLVASLVNGLRAAGNHRVTFDGSALASGVYLYRLTSAQQVISGKMLLMK